MNKLTELLKPVKKKHVEKAIKEFDDLKQKEFLKKYGFGKAKTCWLIHPSGRKGKRYDSKAIVGVAYGFANKKKGPLAPSDFHGGNSVLKKLDELGFECRKEKNGKKVSFK